MSETVEQPLNQPFKKRLPCPLSKADVAQRNEQLLNLWQQKDEAEGDLALTVARAKEEKASHEGRISALEKDMNILRAQIKGAEEIREIDVMEIPNAVTKEIELHRLDFKPGKDGRIVNRRPMDLLDAAEVTPEQADEAAALADAHSETIKPKKSRKKPRVEISESGEAVPIVEVADRKTAVRLTKKAHKKGNGVNAHIDVEAANKYPPLAAIPPDDPLTDDNAYEV